MSSALIGLAVVLACGGGDDIAGNSFPLTSSVTLRGINDDAVQNIHFVINAEAYDASNRVTPSTTKDRSSASTYTWTSDGDVKTFNVFAGRNGVNLDNASVTLTGGERQNGRFIIARWNGTNLTVTKGP